MSESAVTGVSRRTVARGFAWSVPAVLAVAAAAPIAASTAGSSNSVDITMTTQGRCVNSVTVTGTVRVVNTTTSSSLSNLTLEVWIAVRAGTFTSSIAGWSALTLVPGVTNTFGTATTFYQYTATYTGALTPVDGTTQISYSFVETKVQGSGCPVDQRYAVASSIVVDGETLTTDTGLRP